MSLTIVSEAAAEPVEIATLRDHLRITHTAEDAVLSRLIAAARAEFEGETRQRLVTQTLRLTLPRFQSSVLLPAWPVQSIDQIAYIDANGDAATVPVSDYELVATVRPRRVRPAYGKTWPSTRGDANAVTIDFVVGYGADESAMPEDVVTALLLIAGAWYENREEFMAGTITRIPMGARRIMDRHRLAL